MDIPLANDEVLYYRHREQFNTLIKNGAQNSREAAQLFYFLNRTGYNGLCRFNKKGLFNVPFGKYKRISYITDFSHYRPLLTNWEFIGDRRENPGFQSGDERRPICNKPTRNSC